MKIDSHLRKIERFQKTISKLDLKEDSETLIEDFMLTSAHYVNAAMHKMGHVKEDNDIKHNKLFGFIKKEKAFGNISEEVANLIGIIEQLRPSYVYGKGEDTEAAKRAKMAFERIRKICTEVLKDEIESKNSN